MQNKSNLTTGELNAKLQNKIEEVTEKIGFQEKNSMNQHQRFTFTSHEQMMTAIRGVLVSCQLGINCDVIDHSERDFDTVNSKGKKTITTRSVVTLAITLVDLETGFERVSKFVGADQDSSGKSMQQAITQGFKYWCFKNFKVSSTMEVDPDETATQIQVNNSALEDLQKSYDDLKSRSMNLFQSFKFLAIEQLELCQTSEDVKKLALLTKVLAKDEEYIEQVNETFKSLSEIEAEHAPLQNKIKE